MYYPDNIFMNLEQATLATPELVTNVARQPNCKHLAYKLALSVICSE